jgi:NAD(P)H dehydrogenase (quinone)
MFDKLTKESAMPLPTIFVTGPTGKTGTAVVEQLLAQGYPVRAGVHTIDFRSERLRRLGASVVQVDLFDSEGLTAAMQGTQRAYFCPPTHPNMLQAAVSFAVAAQRNGTEAVVGLTQWLASPSHPSLMTRQHWLADQVFSMMPDTLHVTVNPGYFADNYLRFIDVAAQLGVLPVPKDGRNAPPSDDDIARVVVGALIDPQRHHGRTYRPTGPELLDGNQMATVLSTVLDRKVRAVALPPWMVFKALRVGGIDRFQQLQLREYFAEHVRGAFEFGAPTDHVRLVAGVEPETFETTARRYAQLPVAQQTRSNKARAVAKFLRIGVTPRYNLDRFARQQQHPTPQMPSYVMDSTVWRREHSEASAHPDAIAS